MISVPLLQYLEEEIMLAINGLSFFYQIETRLGQKNAVNLSPTASLHPLSCSAESECLYD